VRIRIALSTTVAVIVTTGAFFMLLGSSPAESSARFSAHPKVHQVSGTHFVFSHVQLSFFSVPATVPAGTTGTASTAAVSVVPLPIITLAAPVANPAPVLTDATSVNTADWACIRTRESGDQYNDPAEPSGAYGILYSTWHAFGFSGWPYQAAPVIQDALALRLYNIYGWQPWSSRFACGL
jgi:Transglycosylase-like domain